MIKNFQNEYCKFLKNKSLKLFILFYVFFAGFSVYVYKDLVTQGKMSSLTVMEFAAILSTDIIYKPMIPIFQIVMRLILIEMFTGDYHKGTMKFELMDTPTVSGFFKGKMICGFILYLMVGGIFFLIAIVLGILSFKGGIQVTQIFKLIYLYMLNIIPNMAFLV